MLDLFSRGRPTDWRNRLIWGDKKYVLPSLLPEFAGQVNLIYIDPPFDTGADFSFTTRIPDSETSFTKEPSVIEQKAYRDTWGRGLPPSSRHHRASSTSRYPRAGPPWRSWDRAERRPTGRRHVPCWSPHKILRSPPTHGGHTHD
jgi:hypothetical protein